VVLISRELGSVDSLVCCTRRSYGRVIAVVLIKVGKSRTRRHLALAASPLSHPFMIDTGEMTFARASMKVLPIPGRVEGIG
jgi:hypothetical protein